MLAYRQTQRQPSVTGDPRLASLSALGGAIRYEFWMQARRYALWIGFALLCLLFLRNIHGLLYTTAPYITSARDSLLLWASFLNEFFPLGAGLLLADRFTRDRKTRVDELLDTTPATLAARLLGKYVGAVLATLLPIFLIYALGVVLIMVRWGDVSVIPTALGAFAATTVVSVLFVGAFAIACTTVMWPILFQFLFVGYWFWGNFLNPREGIPTLNGTPLTSDARLIIAGFFPDPGALFDQSVTVGQAFGSLGALLGCAAIALLAAWVWLRWQAAHR
ncbi:MAG TPA: hypothetical protein VMV29_22510 [Ktedonobacterales bacterium]|nr:hypothetical protein [Ktedonobacterales bacterium]